jgi:hypothetical protein
VVAARAEFKDLCLDVADPVRMGTFWAEALGLSEPDGPNAVLTDGSDEHAFWLNRVPEAKTTKHRVHLDVHVASVDDLVLAGATVLDDSQPWTVLADPEGGEFCAFVREPNQLPAYRLYELVIDSRDLESIARWWADRFATEPESEAGQDFRSIEGAGRLPFAMIFTRVPEAKSIKNRLHWDVWGNTEELLTAGAHLIRRRDDEIEWDVLADPEGNEFCVFARE